MRVIVGGAEVDLLAPDELVELVDEKLGPDSDRGKPLLVSIADLEHLYFFGLDSGQEGWFDRSPQDADWYVIPGGRWVPRAARARASIQWEPLVGTEALAGILESASRRGAAVGIVSDDSDTLTALTTALIERFPGIEIGARRVVRKDMPDRLEPYVASGSAEGSDSEANVAKVWLVCLPKPRAEQWLRESATTLGIAVGVALGNLGSAFRHLGFPSGTRFRVGKSTSFLGAEIGKTSRIARGAVRLLAAKHPEQHKLEIREGEPAPVFSTPHYWRSRIRRFLLATDAGIIGLSSFLAYALRDSLASITRLEPFQNEVPVALGVLPLWLIVLYGLGCYRPEVINSASESLRRFGSASLIGALILGFTSFALKLELSRIYVAVFVSLVLVLGTAMRMLVRAYLARQRTNGRYIQRVLIAGADDEAVDIARAMQRVPQAGYRVIGFVDDRLEPGIRLADDLSVLGPISRTLQIAADERAGLVLVSPTAVPPGTLRQLIVALEGTPIDIAVAPSLFEVVTRRVVVESVGTVPLLHVDQIRLMGLRAVAKRTLDVVGSIALLMLTWPLMLACALAIVATDGRPVLFRQRRVGRDGVPFILYKFRTMGIDAEDLQAELEDRNEAGNILFKIRDDPRMTRVGRFLRRWSVDELPQLWNVLKGDMSLVGPRPAVPEEVEKYEPWHLRRLRVRPGITGIWQVSGRSTVPFDEAVRMDLFYIENWSLGLDIVLLLRTVTAVLSRAGAY